MGRPSTVTLKIEKKELSLADNKIKQLFKSRVRRFGSSSGAYVPISQEYENHNVFIVVLDNKK